MRFVRRSLLATLTLGVFDLPADGAAQVTLGLSAGAAFTRFSGDAFDTTEVTTGLRQSASLAIPLGRFVGIAPGVFFVRKGATTELTFSEVAYRTSSDVLGDGGAATP